MASTLSNRFLNWVRHPEVALEAAVIQAQLLENVVKFPKLCFVSGGLHESTHDHVWISECFGLSAGTKQRFLQCSLLSTHIHAKSCTNKVSKLFYLRLM